MSRKDPLVAGSNDAGRSTASPDQLRAGRPVSVRGQVGLKRRAVGNDEQAQDGLARDDLCRFSPMLTRSVIRPGSRCERRSKIDKKPGKSGTSRSSGVYFRFRAGSCPAVIMLPIDDGMTPPSICRKGPADCRQQRCGSNEGINAAGPAAGRQARSGPRPGRPSAASKRCKAPSRGVPGREQPGRRAPKRNRIGRCGRRRDPGRIAPSVFCGVSQRRSRSALAALRRAPHFFARYAPARPRRTRSRCQT
jgi:hypothetical protein